MSQELSQLKCSACRRDSPSVSNEEIGLMKTAIPEWNMIDESGIPKLDRDFKFNNFEEALAFTNQIGAIAELEGHHPRITTEWGKVAITWWTHKIRNLHQNDFIMAAKTDELYNTIFTNMP